MKTELNPAQFFVLPFISLGLIVQVEEKRITAASLWSEIRTIDQTAEGLKHELAF